MRRAFILLCILAALAALASCEKKEEKIYPLTGTIEGRDTASNALTVRHEEIKGYMEAMTMPFPVRGASVGDLPPDGTRIRAELHVTKTNYYLTDVTAE